MYDDMDDHFSKMFYENIFDSILKRMFDSVLQIPHDAFNVLNLSIQSSEDEVKKKR
jgi:hypothetical protein